LREPDGFDALSPRQQADIERLRNQEQRLWFVEFKAKWLLEQGIIEVHGPTNAETSADKGED